MENITITKNQLFKVIKMNEQSEEKPKEGKNETSSFSEMIATLLHSQTQVHIFFIYKQHHMQNIKLYKVIMKVLTVWQTD